MNLNQEAMRLAIEESKKTIFESTKNHPRVGAVIELDGKIIGSAYRGEISLGDHAEYTLLERKLRGTCLYSATLYTTLEPCTERNPPKLSCTQRIINRQIKRIVIGMLDPDQRVHGEGILRLRETIRAVDKNNFDICLFPNELMREIEDSNKDFINSRRNLSSNDMESIRKSGGRIQIISFVISRQPQPSILLGKSPYRDIWMPPQEGVNTKEQMKDAIYRCLKAECNIDPGEIDKNIYFRTIKYLGIIELPKERWGERPVAEDISGNNLEAIVLKTKAYWQAILIVSNQNDIKYTADGKELIDLKWFTIKEAREIIEKTNHQDKAKLLLEGLDECEKSIKGY